MGGQGLLQLLQGKGHLTSFVSLCPLPTQGGASSGLKTHKRNTNYSHTVGCFAAIERNGAGNMLHIRPSERSPYYAIPLIPIEIGGEWLPRSRKRGDREVATASKNESPSGVMKML